MRIEVLIPCLADGDPVIPLPVIPPFFYTFHQGKMVTVQLQ